jgi:hypothetical protein
MMRGRRREEKREERREKGEFNFQNVRFDQPSDTPTLRHFAILNFAIMIVREPTPLIQFILSLFKHIYTARIEWVSLGLS